MLRKAVREDIPSVAAIYGRIHDAEEKERHIGWIRGVYPTEETALAAYGRDELYVWEENGRVVAAGIINKTQVDVYAQCRWRFEAPDDEVSVLHTLTVDPKEKGRGIGKGFVRAWEELARSIGCTVLRLDTNEINFIARSLYAGFGFTEAGIVPCVFNGIPGIRLVCLEKKL